MDKAVLFIDGENFLHKVKDVLKKEDVRIKKGDLSKINLNFLLEKPRKNIKFQEKYFTLPNFTFILKPKTNQLSLFYFNAT